MDLGALDVAVDLDARDDLERPPSLGSLEGLGEALGRVVVGDGEDAHAAIRRLGHKLARGVGAV